MMKPGSLVAKTKMEPEGSIPNPWVIRLPEMHEVLTVREILETGDGEMGVRFEEFSMGVNPTGNVEVAFPIELLSEILPPINDVEEWVTSNTGELLGQ